MMTTTLRLKRYAAVAFHLIGVSTLFGCACLTVLVLSGILLHRTVRFSEPNPVILAAELVFAVFGAGYAVFQIREWMRRN